MELGFCLVLRERAFSLCRSAPPAVQVGFPCEHFSLAARMAAAADRVQFGQRIRKVALRHVSAHDYVRAREIRLHLAYSVKLLDCAVILARVVQNRAVVGGDNERERVELSSTCAFGEGLIEAALERQTLRIPLV